MTIPNLKDNSFNVLKGYFLITSVTGLTLWSYKKRWRSIQVIIKMIYHMICIMALYNYILNVNKWTISKGLNHFKNFTHIITNIIFLRGSIANKNYIKQLYQTLCLLRNTFNIQATHNYKLIIFRLFCTLCYILLFTIRYIELINETPISIMFIHIYHLTSIAAEILVDFLLYEITNSLKLQLDFLYQKMKLMDLQINCRNKVLNNIKMAEVLYKKIFCAVSCINKIFGVIILLRIFTKFLRYLITIDFYLEMIGNPVVMNIYTTILYLIIDTVSK